ncbi:hypothetical protein GCM10009850_047170 [Nonomuraea monospora]|uniref:RiPP n=1 Tax=Nonomuraea monospora TaxID=568818 RepID=A0ABN3CIJ9_9ACTN
MGVLGLGWGAERGCSARGGAGARMLAGAARWAEWGGLRGGAWSGGWGGGRWVEWGGTWSGAWGGGRSGSGAVRGAVGGV